MGSQHKGNDMGIIHMFRFVQTSDQNCVINKTHNGIYTCGSIDMHHSHKLYHPHTHNPHTHHPHTYTILTPAPSSHTPSSHLHHPHTCTILTPSPSSHTPSSPSPSSHLHHPHTYIILTPAQGLPALRDISLRRW